MLKTDIDEKLLGQHAGPRIRESRLLMSTREVLSNMLLGFMAAGLGSAMVFPLDAVCASCLAARLAVTHTIGLVYMQVKTRMQHSRAVPEVQGIYVYKNSWDCFKSIIYKQGGVRSLYRGYAPILMGVTPEKFTKIFVNDHLRYDLVCGNAECGVFIDLRPGARRYAVRCLKTNRRESCTYLWRCWRERERERRRRSSPPRWSV